MKLRVEQLTKTYSDRSVVNGVSLEVNQGQIVGLLGPNGAGKTTTFYMIVGLIRPSSGNVYLDSDKVTNHPMYVRAQKGIGYLAQEASVFRKLSVEDNIKAVLEMTNLSQYDQRLKLNELISEFGLQHIRTTRGDLLSGGERRRTEIARALAVNPKFILLDEPFAALDIMTIKNLQQIIVDLQTQSNISIILCDHQARDLLSCVDLAIVLSNGRVIAKDTPNNLIKNIDAQNAYFGDSFKFN